MHKEQEAQLLTAFRLMSQSDQEMTLALVQKRAQVNIRKPPLLRLVSCGLTNDSATQLFCNGR